MLSTGMRFTGATIVLALLAGCAASALATATAKASPTAFACVKASPSRTGKYSDNECSEAEVSGGRYERRSAVGVTYKSKTGPVVYYAAEIGASLGETITCKKAVDAGKLTGPSVGEDEVTGESCETDGKRCNSTGEPAGKIKDAPLKTEFVGPLASPKVKLSSFGTYVAQFECEGLLLRLSGTTDGAYTAPAEGHANKKSTDVFAGETELRLEASDDGGHNWIGEEFFGYATEEKATSENTASTAVGLE